MNSFSISDMERFSGIKSHTIRMWEQRYGALKPDRSEGNTRFYDAAQLKRLLNIVSLADADHKISELCSMADEKLVDLVREKMQVPDQDTYSAYFISQLIAAAMTFDEQHFEKIFSSCLIRYGLKDSYTKVLYPMLVRVGLMWAADDVPPANEHFISGMVRQKLLAATDALPPPKAHADKWLLFLPENEFHEIGLLFANYLLRFAGKNVIYLGADVPRSSLIDAVRSVKPKYLLLFLVHRDSADVVQRYLADLAKTINADKIFAAGHEQMLNVLKPLKKIHLLRNVDDLEAEL